MPRMRAEASEARRAMVGVIVLSSAQPGTTLHSSGETGRIAAKLYEFNLVTDTWRSPSYLVGSKGPA
jgi:hypothetical protein